MKILHLISGSFHSGAFRGVYNLHSALRKQGVDSKILSTSYILIDSDNEATVNGSLFGSLGISVRSKLDKLVFKPFKPDGKGLFSSGLIGNNFRNHQFYKQADILHLHWINHGFVRIKSLMKVDKPIVWTVRDMWPMTGGCHVNYGCERFKAECGSCPLLLLSLKNDPTRFMLRQKEKYYPKNMKMIGISPWISNQLAESSLFKGSDIQTINNSIDCEEFTPVNKNKAREILKIHTDKKIICMGAQNLHVYHKGFDKFRKAIQYLDKNNYFVLFFGKSDKKILANLHIEHKNFGFLKDNNTLKFVYSSADLFIAPSIMESFGKTIAESMACGTPVVAFNSTGPKTIISHMKNGYLAKSYEPEDLANGIKWITEDSGRQDELSKNARREVSKRYHVEGIAREYNKLYSGLVKND